jgi:hypothetical protein
VRRNIPAPLPVLDHEHDLLEAAVAADALDASHLLAVGEAPVHGAARLRVRVLQRPLEAVRVQPLRPDHRSHKAQEEVELDGLRKVVPLAVEVALDVRVHLHAVFRGTVAVAVPLLAHLGRRFVGVLASRKFSVEEAVLRAALHPRQRGVRVKVVREVARKKGGAPGVGAGLKHAVVVRRAVVVVPTPTLGVARLVQHNEAVVRVPVRNIQRAVRVRRKKRHEVHQKPGGHKG